MPPAKPIRIASFQVNRTRTEFYAFRNYKDHGTYVEPIGQKDDVTADIVPYIEAAKREAVRDVLDRMIVDVQKEGEFFPWAPMVEFIRSYLPADATPTDERDGGE